MGSGSIVDLIGAYSALDFHIKGDDNGDAAAQINDALQWIAARGTPNGILILPPGTYRVMESPIALVSNVAIVGAGSATVLRLGPSRNIDVVTATDVSNVRLRSLRIDGNRTNNLSGTRQGLWLQRVTDGWIEDVEIVSCRRDGFRLDESTRVELKGCKATDNGRHGFSISYSEFCQLFSPRAYDNCKVSDAGDGDGINLELLTNYTTIHGAVCYETAGVGDRQGYPIREAAGEGCHHNSIIGGSGWGNRTSNVPSIDSGDTLCIWPGLVQVPGGISIQP